MGIHFVSYLFLVLTDKVGNIVMFLILWMNILNRKDIFNKGQ